MMTNLKISRLITFSCIFFFLSTARGQHLTNFSPGQIWADNNGVHINAHGGGVLFHKGLYYWYGEHKIAGSAGNSAQVGIHCYSSKDLYNWKDEGIALSVSDDAASDIVKGCILERPKVIYNKRTKKFVMWFHLELRRNGYDAARSGVAVSDHAAGPFKYLKSFRPDSGTWPVNVQPFHKLPVKATTKSSYCGGSGCLPAHPDSLNILGRDFKTGQMARDMNLLVDDDDKAYLIYTSEENSTIHISELTDDYLNCSGNYARAFVNRYMEGATIFRTRDGVYYFIGSDCTGWKPNAARCAFAKHIFGPWTETGNPCEGPDAQLTFLGQSTFVLPVQGKKDAFIFMADKWVPDNPIDGRYLWLPVTLTKNKIRISWMEKWDLNWFLHR